MRWKELMQQQDAFAAAIRKEDGISFAGDPYVKGFRNRIDSNIIHLYFDDGDSGGSVWMHLICGESSALLIDTGYGIGNLQAVIRRLTDLPVTVFNTHWHGDHTGGNAQFDIVYMHEYDVSYWKNALMAPDSRLLPHTLPYEKEALVPLAESKVCTVTDGYTFDLGSRTETVIYTPGHSAGNCMVLDDKTGILFSGDAILSTPTLVIDGFPSGEHPDLLTVKAMKHSLQAHQDILNTVQWLCPSHGRLMLPAGYITAMQQCTQAILQDPDVFEIYDYIPAMPGHIRCVQDAMIVYTANRVR